MFKETAEGQTHYCKACEMAARGASAVPPHTCGKSPTLSTIIKEALAELAQTYWGKIKPLTTNISPDHLEEFLAKKITTAYNSRQSEIDAVREEGRADGHQKMFETHNSIIATLKPYITDIIGAERALNMLWVDMASDSLKRQTEILSATKTPEL
jgi:hypothetical protein